MKNGNDNEKCTSSIYGLYFSAGPLFISLLRFVNDSRRKKNDKITRANSAKGLQPVLPSWIIYFLSLLSLCVLIRHYGCITRLLSNFSSSVKRLKERPSDKEYLPAATGIS